MRYPAINISAEMLPRLGKEPDSVLAAELGVNQTAVARARRRLNRPALRQAHEWTAADDRQLGQGSDQEIADKLGIGRYAVSERRRKLGIPACYPDRNPNLK